MKIRLYLAMVCTFLLAAGSAQILYVGAQLTPAAPDATLKAVTAAKAFLATLNGQQQAAAVLPLNKTQGPSGPIFRTALRGSRSLAMG